MKEYYPEAVRLVKKCIPDVMKSLTNVTWTEVNEEDTIKYKLSSNLTNVNGIKYRFYVSDDYNTNEEDLLVEGNIDNTFSFDKKWDRIFCYGKQVDDFHTLEKEKIFTLYHSAIQEIDKQQTQDKQTINNLQSEVTNLKTEVNTLKTENAELKSIIDKLKTATSFEDFKSKI